jgi:hypothetical protein
MLPLSPPTSTGPNARPERFEPIFSQPHFEGLKAILGRLASDGEALCAAILNSNTYEQLLATLGYKLVLIRQIHVQDAYSRTGPEGAIRAVLPYYDIPTQRSLPTLVNFDRTLTTTPNAAAFFEGLLRELKKQLGALT